MSTAAHEPGRTAYEARFAGFTLGPRGVAEKWEDLLPVHQAIWARVEEAVFASARPSPGALVRSALATLVSSLDDLIADSEGVAGLHRNGDVATWDELVSGGRFEDWLSSLDRARAALSASIPIGEGEAPARVPEASRQPDVPPVEGRAD